MNEWKIAENVYDSARIMQTGTKFYIGNGYMGSRGTLEEFEKKQLCAITLAGVYDKVGDLWREPVNAPVGFYTKVTLDGEDVIAQDIAPLFHSYELSLKDAALVRDTDFEKIQIKSERFASAADIHLMAMRYTVCVRQNGRMKIVTGIDGRIWDINGPHLPHMVFGQKGGAIYADARTGELGLGVAEAETIRCDFECSQSVAEQDRRILRTLEFDAKKGESYTFYKYIAIFTSADGVQSPLGEAVERASAACEKGYGALKAEHEKVWLERWEAADVRIEGDSEAQAAMRYNIYVMYSTVPTHTDKVAIPARGLSGQVYKGAMFWDTEIYMMPLFNYTSPDLAKNLARYRVNTLEGAREKAREYGHMGAFYAWECQETGEDACTDFAVIDVFTGRPLRTHFRDQQIHISGDVAYGIWEHYIASGDERILLDGGAEVILECARFFYSYAYFKKNKNRYELLEVTCADEYHERVHNNFYTNIMAKYTLEMAVKVIDLIKSKYPEKYDELMKKLDYEKDLDNIVEMEKLLYLPEPDEDGVIEQFDGYNKLECPTVEELRSRILDPREHLGAPVGLMTETQIIKQADVVLGLLLFSDRYPIEIRKKNWLHYEPRCEHGSTLSTAIYAVLAAQIGLTDWAYEFFMKTATIDIRGQYRLWVGDLFIGGSHTAANGGTWIAAVQGFGGFKFDGEKVILNPNLPEKWTGLSFRCCCRGSRYEVSIRRDGMTVSAVSGDCGHRIEVFGKNYRLQDGKLEVKF